MDKEEKYRSFLEQAKALIVPEVPREGNFSNLLALLKKEFEHFWVGLYMRDGDKLYLGCFQGEPACTVITIGRGVCGTSAAKGETVIVNDVLNFPGYIACHPEPRSEIVVPGFSDGEVSFVLDVDSIYAGYFDDIDKEGLEKFVKLLEGILAHANKRKESIRA